MRGLRFSRIHDLGIFIIARLWEDFLSVKGDMKDFSIFSALLYQVLVLGIVVYSHSSFSSRIAHCLVSITRRVYAYTPLTNSRYS